jgi:hypothetical protein
MKIDLSSIVGLFGLVGIAASLDVCTIAAPAKTSAYADGAPVALHINAPEAVQNAKLCLPVGSLALILL